MVITTSACRTASAGSSWAVAPSAASWAAGSGVRFHTSTVKPARSRLCAIPWPIVPAPSTATRGRGPAAPEELMSSSPRWLSLRRLCFSSLTRTGQGSGRAPRGWALDGLERREPARGHSALCGGGCWMAGPRSERSHSSDASPQPLAGLCAARHQTRSAGRVSPEGGSSGGGSGGGGFIRDRGSARDGAGTADSGDAGREPGAPGRDALAAGPGAARAGQRETHRHPARHTAGQQGQRRQPQVAGGRPGRDRPAW